MCIRGVGSKRVSSDEFALQGNSSLTTRTDAGCGSGWVRVFAGCPAICTPSESTLDVTAQNSCPLLERRVALELDGVHHLEGILGMLVGVLRRVGIISLHTVGHGVSPTETRSSLSPVEPSHAAITRMATKKTKCRMTLYLLPTSRNGACLDRILATRMEPFHTRRKHSHEHIYTD
jgi:hypothetical protein